MHSAPPGCARHSSEHPAHSSERPKLSKAKPGPLGAPMGLRWRQMAEKHDMIDGDNTVRKIKQRRGEGIPGSGCRFKRDGQGRPV